MCADEVNDEDEGEVRQVHDIDLSFQKKSDRSDYPDQEVTILTELSFRTPLTDLLFPWFRTQAGIGSVKDLGSCSE